MKSMELFAGAFGLGMGSHFAGFQQELILEKDPWCCQTIRENIPSLKLKLTDDKLIHGRIEDYDFRNMEGKIDLITGGPPCQPFSQGGKHKSHRDTRDMFPQAIRAIAESKPKSFLIENVKGLTRQSFSNYFEYIKLQLTYPTCKLKRKETWSDHLRRLERLYTRGRSSQLKYNIVTRVLNAADYGVPQKRERVFFVGFRTDLEIEWHFPNNTHSQQSLLWSMKTGEYWELNKISKKLRNIPEQFQSKASKIVSAPDTKPWVTIRTALRDLPDPELHPIKSKKFIDHTFQPGARSYVGHTGSILDAPSKTLKAGVHGVPGGENMLRRLDGSVRYFSIRECARIQCFPDDYKFHGSWTTILRQLGNAVPVDLAKTLSQNIKTKLLSI